MSLTNRWGKQNSLIRRVRQHGALTTLFRAMEERTLTPPSFTVGVVPTTRPVAVQEPMHEVPPSLPDPIDDQAVVARHQIAPASVPSRLERPSAEAIVAPLPSPVASPIVMRTTLPDVTVTRPLTSTPATPLTRPAPVRLSPPSQPAAMNSREHTSRSGAPPVHSNDVPDLPPTAVQPAIQSPTGVVSLPNVAPAAPTTTSSVGETGAAFQPAASGMDDATWARLRAIMRKHQAREAAENLPDPKPPTMSKLVLPPQAAAPAGNPVQRQVVNPPPVSPAAVSEPSSPRAENVLDKSQFTAFAQASDVTDQTETDALMSPVASLAAPVEPAVQTMHRQGLESTIPEPHVPSPITSAEPLPLESGAMMTSADPTEGPKAPLQAVWPVQRLTDDDTATATTELPAYVGPPPPEPPELRRQLSALPTAQPTESSIDLVLPRRPRPVRPGSPVPSTPATQSDALPIQRQLAPTAAPASPTDSAPLAGAVETEIGPLPADLWQLIGEKPPQASLTPATVPASQVQRTPAESITHVTDGSPTTAIEAKPSMVSAADFSRGMSDVPSAATASTYAAFMPAPLTPDRQPDRGASAVTSSVLPSAGDLAPNVAMRQIAHQAVPETSEGAFTTAAPLDEVYSTGGEALPKKKTQVTRRAPLPAKTSRRRRKRMMPI